MPPTKPVKEQPLEKRLREQIIPWVNTRGIAHVFIAQPSWRALQQSETALPERYFPPQRSAINIATPN